MKTNKININYISDLHSSFYLPNNKNIFWNDWIINYENKSEILIIAWDINESVDWIRATLDDIINNTDYRTIIITFWNHCIRKNSEDKKYWINNSIDKYEFLINYFHWYRDIVHVIDKQDYIIKDSKLVVTGNISWYNYTWINERDRYYLEKFYKVNFDQMSFIGFTSNEKAYIQFNDKIKSNIEFAEHLENKLIERLDLIKKSTKTKEFDILAISHIKPSREIEKESEFYLTYSDWIWQEIIRSWYRSKYDFNLWNLYWNAFYSNNNLHEIYKKYWVKYSIYWHTHTSNEYEFDWIKYVTNAFGYYGYNTISKTIKNLEIKT